MNRKQVFRYASTFAVSAALSACVLTRERPAEQPGVSGQQQEVKSSAELDSLVKQLGGKVNFAFDSSELTPGSKQALANVGEYLSKHPDQKIRIDGFTDNVGSGDYNQQLSSSRANSVAMALQDAGAKSDQIVALGHGDSQPVASNDSDQGRAENRRAEISVA